MYGQDCSETAALERSAYVRTKRVRSPNKGTGKDLLCARTLRSGDPHTTQVLSHSWSEGCTYLPYSVAPRLPTHSRLTDSSLLLLTHSSLLLLLRALLWALTHR